MNSCWFKFYDKNVPKTVSTEVNSLYEVLETKVVKNPNVIAFIGLGKVTLLSSFFEMVNQLSRQFKIMRISRGDRIAILFPNLLHFPVIMYACLKNGIILVPINPLLSANEISGVIRLAEPKLFIYLNLFTDKINKLDEISGVQYFVKAKLTDFASFRIKVFYPLLNLFKKKIEYSRSETLLVFKDLLQKNKNFEKIAAYKPDKSDVALLLCTGGTTGTPKLAKLTNINILINTLQIAACIPHIKNESKFVAVLPLFHSFGLTTCLNVPLMNSSPIILHPRFSSKKLIKSIIKHKASVLPGVPIMFAAIAKHLEKKGTKKLCLTDCFSGGTELKPEIAKQFKRITGVSIVEAYGLTETSPGLSMNPVKGVHKPFSVGIPLPSTEIKVINTNKQTVLATGEIGEIIVKGPQVMEGYWRNENENNIVLNDGWLYTGDLGKIDEDGFIFITGRKKEMISHCGFKIYPQEVESILLLHPEISEAGVCPIPDGYKGEAVKAVVVIHEESELTEKKLIIFCKERLAHFKVPKKIVFVEELPKTYLGKVLRRSLIDIE